MQAFQRVISPDIVDVLRREHEQIRQLCTDVREAGPERRDRTLAALHVAFHRHQLGEFAVAHPAATGSGPNGDAIARSCQTESERIGRSLTELGRLGVGHPHFDAGFAALSGALPDHAARQERDETMTIAKAVVVAALRERGEHDRADFVDRELPERINPARHVGLLAMLHLDVATLTERSEPEYE